MSKKQRFEAIQAEYFLRFGELPSTQWIYQDCHGRLGEYMALLRAALDTGKPVPEWEAAHGVPENALT